VFKSSKDVNLLVRTFKRLVGEPDAIILTGASLGGIVTADALERANLKNVVGAYPFCGALAGSRTWDGGFDLRLTYNAICDDVPGGAIPGGPTGLPPGIPFISGEQIAVAVNACTGLLTPPEFQTPEQQANLAQLLGSTQLPPQFIITDLFFGTNGLSNLTFDPGKLNGGQGIGNSDVTYADPDIDARIERVLTQRKAARKLQRNFTPSGELQNEDVKIVSMHTDKDGLVIVEHEREYQDVIDPDQLTVAIVVEEQPSHCGFSPAELTAGWESLRGWLAGAPQPSAASIQGTCQAIEGFVGGPCRIDPSFEVPDMDGRIPPRDNIRNSVKPE
jgi:hypothetical protein